MCTLCMDGTWTGVDGIRVMDGLFGRRWNCGYWAGAYKGWILGIGTSPCMGSGLQKSMKDIVMLMLYRTPFPFLRLVRVKESLTTSVEEYSLLNYHLRFSSGQLDYF